LVIKEENQRELWAVRKKWKDNKKKDIEGRTLGDKARQDKKKKK
jgi:hypothetical protein